MDLNTIVFDDVKFSDILKEIHQKCKSKNQQIEKIISDLLKKIKGIDDATIISPLIKEFLDVDVKNNEHIVKMAAIIQRSISNNRMDDETQSNYEDIKLTDNEKKIFMKSITEELNQLKEDINEEI